MQQTETTTPDESTFSQQSIRILRKFVMTLAITWLLVCIMLTLFETFLIYPAPKFPMGNWEPDFAHENVDFESSDGTKLHGWLLRNEATTDRHILVCHGNGENVAYATNGYGKYLRRNFNANVFVFDYRGYGKSEGKPFEIGIKQDGERAMEIFCKKLNVKPKDVIVLGSSLGGGVATHIASTKGCKALVLQRTFDSLVNVAADKYPIFPVRWLMQNRYDSVSALKKYDGPVFQSHGTADRVVPIHHGEALHKATSNPNSKFIPIKGNGHNSVLPLSYWEAFEEWLKELEAEGQ